MITKVRDYANLVKFEHTIFALPFALIGYTLAITQTTSVFHWEVLVAVLLCMVFARNTAMGFNRYLDREIDAENPRTARREIPAGVITARNAALFVAFNALLFIATTWFINRLVFFLSPIALIVVMGYSYMKRITPLCHFVLSAGLALAPIGAYLAVTGKFALVPILFSFIVFFWVSGFDIIYASQDVEFDRQKGLNSVPVLLGVKKALRFSAVIHILAAIMVVWAGIDLQAHWIYWTGAVIFIGLLTYQQSIVKHDDLSKVGLAFGTTNGIASVIFAIFVITSLYN
jgi:4-hydroxybenzoate polyprenyltransferase